MKSISEIAIEQIESYGKAVNDASKEYASEKISIESKRDTIKTGADIAVFRITTALRKAKAKIVQAVSEKRMLDAETINEILDDYLQ